MENDKKENKFENNFGIDEAINSLLERHDLIAKTLSGILYIIGSIWVTVIILGTIIIVRGQNGIFYQPNQDGTVLRFIYGSFLVTLLITTIFLINLYKSMMSEFFKIKHSITSIHRINVAIQTIKGGIANDIFLSNILYDLFPISNRNLKISNKIESPIPGLPSSDIGTSTINGILDIIDKIQNNSKPAKNNN